MFGHIKLLVEVYFNPNSIVAKRIRFEDIFCQKRVYLLFVGDGVFVVWNYLVVCGEIRNDRYFVYNIFLARRRFKGKRTASDVYFTPPRQAYGK